MRLAFNVALLLACLPCCAATRFALLSDIHVGTTGTNYEAGEPDSNCWFVKTNFNPDFVIVTGDVTDTGASNQLWTATNMLLTIFGASNYVIWGNHDGSSLSRTFLPGKFHFLNGTYSYTGVSSYGYDLDQDALDYVNTNLQSSAGYIHIVFSHLPVFTNSLTIGNLMNDNGLTNLVALMQSNRVQAYFHGHVHWPGSSCVESRSVSNTVTQISVPSLLETCEQNGYYGQFVICDLDGYTLTMRRYLASPHENYPLMFTTNLTFLPNIGTNVLAGNISLSGNARISQ